jgi:small subunit ribosomal protein S16
VAVKIKLKRLGKIREPYYRIVVADSRTKRDGRAIEEIGKYHPKAEPSLIEVNSERVQHWLSVGAQPTDPVRVLLKITGDWQKFRGEPGSEGTLRTAAPREDKKERFDTAAKESQAAKEKDEKASGSAKTGSRSAKSTQGGKARTAPAKAEDAPAAKAEDAPAAKAEAPAVKAEDAPAVKAEAPAVKAEDAPAAKAEDAPAVKAEAPAVKAEDAPAAEAAPAEVASAASEAAPAESAPAEAAADESASEA